MPKTPENVFGRRLYEARTVVLGLTNSEGLADALGVSARSVEAYEQGDSLPGGETVWRLFHLLGPERFAALMPHIGPPQRIDAGDFVVRSSEPDRAERLRVLISEAQKVLDEQD